MVPLTEQWAGTIVGLSEVEGTSSTALALRPDITTDLSGSSEWVSLLLEQLAVAFLNLTRARTIRLLDSGGCSSFLPCCQLSCPPCLLIKKSVIEKMWQKNQSSHMAVWFVVRASMYICSQIKQAAADRRSGALAVFSTLSSSTFSSPNQLLLSTEEEMFNLFPCTINKVAHWSCSLPSREQVTDTVKAAIKRSCSWISDSASSCATLLPVIKTIDQCVYMGSYIQVIFKGLICSLSFSLMLQLLLKIAQELEVSNGLRRLQFCAVNFFPFLFFS